MSWSSKVQFLQRLSTQMSTEEVKKHVASLIATKEISRRRADLIPPHLLDFAKSVGLVKEKGVKPSRYSDLIKAYYPDYADAIDAVSKLKNKIFRVEINGTLRTVKFMSFWAKIGDGVDEFREDVVVTDESRPRPYSDDEDEDNI